MKAVFIDHMGTIVNSHSKFAYALIKECYENSRAGNMEEMERFWFSKHEELLKIYNGNQYKEEYEIALETFELVKQEIGLQGDAAHYCGMLTQHWMYAPAFEEVDTFFTECPLPIYLVTNNDTKYIEESMHYLGLKPAGIITSQTAGCYKPQPGIFEKALEISGCAASEAIHIGDSMESDIKGAAGASIQALLLDRTGQQQTESVPVIHSLAESFQYL